MLDDHDVYRRHSMHIAYRMNQFLLPHLAQVYARFGGDIECALILGEIAHYSAEAIFGREPVFEGADAIPNEQVKELVGRLKKCNALSISMVTGIPRETVRRKIRWLEQQGWIAKDDKGMLVVYEGTVDDFEDFNFGTLRQFLATADELRQILSSFPDDGCPRP